MCKEIERSERIKLVLIVWFCCVCLSCFAVKVVLPNLIWANLVKFYICMQLRHLVCDFCHIFCMVHPV